MKKTRILVSLLTLFLEGVTYAQKAPEVVSDGYKVVIKTSAICEMCKETLEYDLAFEKGVKSATLDLKTKEMTVVYNEKKTSDTAIRQRISKVGYHADNIVRDPVAYEKLPFCCKDGAHQDK